MFRIIIIIELRHSGFSGNIIIILFDFEHIWLLAEPYLPFYSIPCFTFGCGRNKIESKRLGFTLIVNRSCNLVNSFRIIGHAAGCFIKIQPIMIPLAKI